MCQRGLHNQRYQRHLLRENLPENEPAFAAYVQENAVLEVFFR